MPLRRRTLRSRLVVLSIYILIYIRRRARLRTKTVLTTRFPHSCQNLTSVGFVAGTFLFLLTPSYSFQYTLTPTYIFTYLPIFSVVFPPKSLPFCLLLYLDLLPRELRSSLYLLIHLRTRRSALSRGELEEVAPTTRPKKLYLFYPSPTLPSHTKKSPSPNGERGSQINI